MDKFFTRAKETSILSVLSIAFAVLRRYYFSKGSVCDFLASLGQNGTQVG